MAISNSNDSPASASIVELPAAIVTQLPKKQRVEEAKPVHDDDSDVDYTEATSCRKCSDNLVTHHSEIILKDAMPERSWKNGTGSGTKPAKPAVYMRCSDEQWCLTCGCCFKCCECCEGEGCQKHSKHMTKAEIDVRMCNDCKEDYEAYGSDEDDKDKEESEGDVIEECESCGRECDKDELDEEGACDDCAENARGFFDELSEQYGNTHRTGVCPGCAKRCPPCEFYEEEGAYACCM